MKLTLLANGHSELFEDDAADLCEFYEQTGRTIPRAKWVDELRAAAQERELAARIEAERKRNERVL